MAQVMADIAKPVLVYGLTQALGSAFAPLVAGLAKITPSGTASLKPILDKRGQILTDAIDQYAGGTAMKPGDFKRSPQAPDAKAQMLIGPWNALWDQLKGNADFKAVATPFQSFAMASVQRLAASGVAPRDAAVLNNVLVMLALGVFAYWQSGEGKSADPKAWASAAIDRSGIIDLLTSDVHVAVDRDTLSRLSQATAGGAGLTRRLLPLHNLFHVRRLFDAMKAGGDHAFGIQVH